ncbi:MAG: DUF1073 domain-containing protein [Thermoplasmata archaeon]|nr:DUF1073 domain-containing protein [Thermoplasmata archaeon]
MSFARKAALRAVEMGAVSIGAAQSRLDGWMNVLTGLGTNRSKENAGTFGANPLLTPQELEDLFHHDDMANRIVSAVPHDALRQGFNVRRATEEGEGSDASVEEVQEDSVALDKLLEELGLGTKAQEAMVWGRLFGGGFLLLGLTGAGKPNTPLEEEKVTGVEFLTVLDRRDLQPETYYQSPLAPKYGEVETYRVLPLGAGPSSAQEELIVHETRLVKFGGSMTSRRERERNQGWDHSVLQKVIGTLRQTGGNWDSVVAMMADMSQAVFKLKGLIDTIAEDNQEDLQTRMSLMDTLRSITRAIVLDAEDEEFQLVERNMSGVGDLLDRTWLRLAAAARMPVTILMGQAPAGLNATGSIDLRWWYDTVRFSQEYELRPRLLRVVRMVARGAFQGTDPESWEVVFPSLWQMTPTEEAELRAKVAETDAKYIQAGVCLPEEVTLSRWGRGEYSTDYVVDLEVRKEVLETELEALANPPEPPPLLPGQPTPEAPGAPGAPAQAAPGQPVEEEE